MSARIRQELEAQNKKIIDDGLQIFAGKTSVQAVQKSVGVLSNRIDEVNKVLSSITESMKTIPSKRELCQDQVVMDEKLAQVKEINTGMTPATEQYKFSESTPFEFQQSVAGPSGTQQHVHPQRMAAFQSPSLSSLRDTESASTWMRRIRGGAGSDGAPGGAGGGGDPPPPPDPPPSECGGAGGRRMSRRQRWIKELEFTKPIKIKESKKVLGKPGEDFDTQWVLVQLYIEDQPEKFPKDEQTIDCIGSLMDGYAAAWRIHWLKGTLVGIHPKLMTGYVNALKPRFKDKDAKDEAYANLEKVRYDACIRDMCTQIQTFNDKAMATGAALKELILEWLPQKIIEHMHTVDLTGTNDQEIITIMTNAGRTAEKWEAARKNLRLKATLRTYGKRFTNNNKSNQRTRKKDRSEKLQKCSWDVSRAEQNKFKNHRSERRSNKDFSKTEEIESSEIEPRKAAGECLWCVSPGEEKGSHRVKDCMRPIKWDKGTASYPKPKIYQKMKVAGLELDCEEEGSSSSKSDSSDSGSKEESSDEEEEESEGEYLDEKIKEEQQEEETEMKWWDLPSDCE